MYGNDRGMALITILLMLIILVMLMSALVAMNTNNIFYASTYLNKISASAAAESGIAYAIYALQKDPSFNSDIQEHTECGNFTVNFCRTGYKPEYFSYNNLTNGSPVAGGSFDGEDVLPYSVDLVVTGNSGPATKRIRVTLTRSITNDAGRISGWADVDGGIFRVSRVITPQDPSGQGSFHSNSSGNPLLDPPLAIKVDPNCQVITSDGVISAVGNISLNSTDTTLKEGSLPKQITSIDIDGIISTAENKIAHSPGGDYRVKGSHGNYKLYHNGSPVDITGITVNDKGAIVINKDVFFEGDMKVSFEVSEEDLPDAGIVLEKKNDRSPVVYIKSDGAKEDSLNIIGKITGNGSVCTSGKTKFIMETDIVSDLDPGVALLSKDDVNIHLPATHVRPAELNMTGLVYTYGNINADFYKNVSPSDNPVSVSAWPADWEDIVCGVSQEVYALPVDNFDIYDTVDPPSIPGFYWNFTGGNHNDPFDADDPCNGTITENPDGTFTFNGGASNGNDASIRYFSGPHGSGKRGVPFVIGDGNEVTLTEHGFEPPLTIRDSSLISDFGSEENLYKSLYGTLKKYDLKNNSRSKLVYTVPCDGKRYAPNINITGALVITDPNNLDGSGAFNPQSGNMTVKLRDPDFENKGNLSLIYSSNYEKLLGNSSISGKLRVTSWEELKL